MFFSQAEQNASLSANTPPYSCGSGTDFRSRMEGRWSGRVQRTFFYVNRKISADNTDKFSFSKRMMSERGVKGESTLAVLFLDRSFIYMYRIWAGPFEKLAFLSKLVYYSDPAGIGTHTPPCGPLQMVSYGSALGRVAFVSKRGWCHRRVALRRPWHPVDYTSTATVTEPTTLLLLGRAIGNIPRHS